MSLQDAAAIIEGERPAGADWADGYPTDATIVAAAMRVVADREGSDLGPWSVFQVVRNGQVVGGMGFIEALDATGAVRIGFSETDRADDAMAAALRQLIEHARRHGATRVRAEAGDARQAEVLTAAGMHEVAAHDGVRHFEA